MAYDIVFERPAQKAYMKLPKSAQMSVIKALKRVAQNPRGQGTCKLQRSDLYRIRAGVYRILYKIIDNELIVVVMDVGHRKDVYKNI